MSDWLDRIHRRVSSCASVLIRAGEEWGPSRVISSLRKVDQPLVWLDMKSLDFENPADLGNALSEAIRVGLGAPLFGMGADAKYGFAVFESYLPALEPITFAVGRADKCLHWAQRFLTAVLPPNLLVLQVPTGYDASGFAPVQAVLDAPDLALSLHEALDLFGDERSREEIRCALESTGGAIEKVEEVLGLSSSDTELGERGRSHLHALAAGQLGAGVDALVLRSRWIEAFEAAARGALTRVPELIEEAGHQFFDTGQFDRFWHVVSRLPSWVLRDESVMYWRFSAAIAVNRWQDLLPIVDKYLRAHAAPNLRALRAAVEVSGDSLGQAKMAYEAESNAITASALGFVLTVDGDQGNALRVLREAMDHSERSGRSRLIVSVAGNIAIAHLSSGHYIRAQYWATWAVRQFHAFGLREELLRLRLVNFAAFAHILTGAVATAEQILATIHVTDKMIGIPTVEGALSTLGDLAVVRGDIAGALDFYERAAASASRGDLPTVANDLVRAYAAAGRLDDAVAIATEAAETASEVSEVHERVAALALGSALAHSFQPDAEGVLRTAMKGFSERPFGAYCAQATIHLSRLLFRQGRLEEARALLEENSRFIAELGDSGWLLLGGDGPEVAQLKRMFRSGEPELQLRLLGKRSLRIRETETSLSMRVAELLTVLAAHPDGIRGEQLAVALYGDRANASTLKAMVSRARRQLPIEAKPYRIADAYQADFMQVLELLHVGKVQAALELYRGQLLPESDAPAIVELREHLEESMRQAVLASGDPDAMIDLANQHGDDLELWEETRRNLPPNDPRRPLTNARIRRIRKRWQSEAD